MGDNLTILAMGAATLVKVLIDLARMGMDMPRWLPPLLALFGGVGLVVLMQVAAGVPLGPQRLAESVLAGILAGGAAVGATELGRRADTRAVKGPSWPEEQ